MRNCKLIRIFFLSSKLLQDYVRVLKIPLHLIILTQICNFHEITERVCCGTQKPLKWHNKKYMFKNRANVRISFVWHGNEIRKNKEKRLVCVSVCVSVRDSVFLFRLHVFESLPNYSRYAFATGVINVVMYLFIKIPIKYIGPHKNGAHNIKHQYNCKIWTRINLIKKK